MANALRFNEGMKNYIVQVQGHRCTYPHSVKEPGVDIQLDGKRVGCIACDGKVTIVTNTIGEAHHVAEVSFTETQWMAIAIRAREFKERCARIAQEQQDRILDQAYEEMEALGALPRT